MAGCFVAVMAAGRSRHGLRLFYFHLLVCHTLINGEGANNGEKNETMVDIQNLNLRKGYKSIKKHQVLHSTPRETNFSEINGIYTFNDR
jgi:hypothetical protein